MKLTPQQYDQIKDVLPVQRGNVVVENIDFLNAILYIAENDDDTFSPHVTLWAFLSQMLFTGPLRSCVAATQRVRELCRVLGKEPPSLTSGGYCKARGKIESSISPTKKRAKRFRKAIGLSR